MGESDPIIRVEGLGKKYVLSRQPEGRGRYESLRDALMNGLRAAARRLVRPFPRAERPGREEFWALRDVSFEVQRGEVVGIIGRNGAGKSTLLKVLSRITEPTAGRVTLDGRVASLLEVGTGFHPELTGRENVYLNGAVLGMSRAEIKKKFDEIVAFAEVEKFLDTPVKRYSSGMYMRLAFAVAAHLEPEILVVDEVLAVGDAQFQTKCMGKMGEVAKGGRTVLFVSHNLVAIQLLCRKAILIQSGRLTGFGPVGDEIRAYQEEMLSGGELTEGSRRLSQEIELCRLTCSPRVVESGQAVRFTISLRAWASLVIEHLCLLIYSSLDIRVAIIDLRRDEGPYKLADGQVLTVEAGVDRLDVVEGEYRMGVYLQGGATRSDFLDLAHIKVLPRRLATSVVPYNVIHRGVIELTHRMCEVNVQ